MFVNLGPETTALLMAIVERFVIDTTGPREQPACVATTNPITMAKILMTHKVPQGAR